MARILDGQILPTRTARQLGRLLLLYGLLGLLAGGIAAIFVELIALVGDAFKGLLGSDPTNHAGPVVGAAWPPALRRLPILIVPALGGLGAGLLSARFAPETAGPGVGSVIEAFHERRGQMRRRVSPIKAVTSALTLGTGGSGGVEGPIGFIVAGLGSTLARVLRLSTEDRRRLVMAGFAAGIGAVFHAPMAASLFAAEVLYRELDLEYEVLLPAIIASTMAYAVYGTLHGWQPIWSLPATAFNASELLPYLGLALLLGVAAFVFIQLELTVIRLVGEHERIPAWARPAVGGLGVGLIGYFVPDAMGIGYGIIGAAALGYGAAALLGLALAKMATSALTAGSGGSGGLFAPSLVIGGALGGAFASFVNWLSPGAIAVPASFVVVGMAGFFAAVISAPISTVIMVSELTGSYQLLVPALWVCGITWFLLRKRGLFSQQPATRFDAPGHLGDMLGAVLRKVSVSSAVERTRDDVVTSRLSTGLKELLRLSATPSQTVVPVVSDDGTLLGVVDGRRMRSRVGELTDGTPLLAADFLSPALVIGHDESLQAAFAKMEAADVAELVVVNAQTEIEGLISRQEIIAAYYRSVSSSAVSERNTTVADGRAEPAELAAAVRRGGVLIDVGGGSAHEVIANLVQRTPALSAADPDKLVALILEREALASTDVGEGVALPHPSTRDVPGLSEDIVVLARLEAPVQWSDPPAEQAEPVRIVALLVALDQTHHLQLISQLARRFNDPRFKERMLSAAGEDEVLAALDDD